MSSYVITVNERVTLGKVLLDYLKSLSKTSDFLDIIAQKDSDLTDERFFTKEDFKRIENSKKSGICDDIAQLEDLLKSKK